MFAILAGGVARTALIGKRRTELRQMLRRPDRGKKADHVWEWDIGVVNDYLGPGDDGTLRIRFDRSTRRSAKAATSP